MGAVPLRGESETRFIFNHLFEEVLFVYMSETFVSVDRRQDMLGFSPSRTRFYITRDSE